MAFEPGFGTLTALEREFCRRLTRRLRAVKRGSASSLFEKHPEREDSLIDRYPFCLPALRSLDAVDIHPKVTFFIGENGSGKSTKQ
jgi:ABC-type multidrug transport system ATPase subunit